jgi:hypothetical protein
MAALAGKAHPQNRPIRASRIAAPKLEADRVEGSLGGQMRAPGIPSVRTGRLRIAQIAVQAHRLVIADGISRTRSAAPCEAISQRQPMAMRPEFLRVRQGRNKVGTSQRTRSCCSTILRGKQLLKTSGLPKPPRIPRPPQRAPVWYVLTHGN